MSSSKWDILVLDRSASMIHNIDKIKAGFADLVKEQKEQGSTNRFTVVGFNTEVEIMRDETFPDVSDLTQRDIYTKGCTALLDAVGTVYDMILENSEKKDVLITIITDGFENSSKKYTFETLNEKKKLLDENNNVKIVFIGTDINCLKGNVLLPHVSQSVNVNGNMLHAMKTASRTMSNQRENTDYVPEGTIDVSQVSDNSFTPMLGQPHPHLKRQHSYRSGPPPVAKCGRLCSLN